jgi:hypothetical protein
MNPPVIAGALAADSGSLLTFTRVVDHEHFGKARARRVTSDAVAEREGERVPDQRAIVDDGVGQDPIGVAG